MVEKLLLGDPAFIGPYKLLRRLGRGRMGVVYLARSPGGRSVAVKVIHPWLAGEPGFRAQFAREVAAARLVGGVFTALVVDADTDAALPWLATAYVAEPSLAEAVDSQGPLPPESVLALAAGLVRGLQAIHAVGMVHRDLKPSNVLLAADGPRVTDFGISRALETASTFRTGTGVDIGIVGYFSPEQAAGLAVGPPSDIFSLGCVLAYAAAGDEPFSAASTLDALSRVVREEPNLSRVPASLRPLIEWCLAKDPAARPTLDELLAKLDELGARADAHAPEWLQEPMPAQTPSSDAMVGSSYGSGSPGVPLRAALTDLAAAAVAAVLPSTRSSRSHDPQASQLDDPVSRAVRESVRPGLLAFNPPTEMTQGKKERVEVGIVRSPELREALSGGLRGRGELQFENIPTSTHMGVELRGPSFEIVSFSDPEQAIAPTARWEFDVLPYRSGYQTLTLCVSMRIKHGRSSLAVGGNIAIPVLEREIRIRINLRYGILRFTANNWQWLIATILGLGGALAAWVTLVH